MRDLILAAPVSAAVTVIMLAGSVIAAEPPSPAERLTRIETEVTGAEKAFRAAWEKQTQPWPMSPGVE
jgi:hypothetical protein